MTSKWVERGVSAGMVVVLLLLLYILHRMLLFWGTYQAIQEAPSLFWRNL